MTMVAEVLRVGPTYAITIKRRLRAALGIEPGRLLVAEVRDGVLTLTPLPKDPVGRLGELLEDVDLRKLGDQAESQPIAEAQASLARKTAGKATPLKVLQEFLAAVPDKTPAPDNIDWDGEYYQQFE